MELAYRELKELEALKNDIISNVSHELKTPIAIIGSLLNLLADEDEKHIKVELVEKARTALKNQTKIVDDLLEASRIRKGGTG